MGLSESECVERLVSLALEAHEEEPSVEHGCLMMIEVLRLPRSVQLCMASCFGEFAQALRLMAEP